MASETLNIDFLRGVILDPHGMLDCYPYKELVHLCRRCNLSWLGSSETLRARLRTYAVDRLAAFEAMDHDQFNPDTMDCDQDAMEELQSPAFNPLANSTSRIRSVRPSVDYAPTAYSIEQIDDLTPVTLRHKASKVFPPPSPPDTRPQDTFVFGSLDPRVNGNKGTRATLDTALENVVAEMHARIAKHDDNVPRPKMARSVSFMSRLGFGPSEPPVSAGVKRKFDEQHDREFSKMDSIANSWAGKKRRGSHRDLVPTPASEDRNITGATDSLISRSLKKLRVEQQTSAQGSSQSAKPQPVPATAQTSPRKNSRPALRSKASQSTGKSRERAGRRLSMPGQPPRRSPRKSSKIQKSGRAPTLLQGVQAITRPHPPIRRQGGDETCAFRVPSLEMYSRAPSKAMLPHFASERFQNKSPTRKTFAPVQAPATAAQPKPAARSLPRFAAPTASSLAKTTVEKELPPLPLRIRKRPLATQSTNVQGRA